MKHTYLYPLGPGEGWLWRVARTDATDLFGDPDTEEVKPLWVMQDRISGAIGKAREEFHKRIKDRDRVCIGRHYMIPGSLCEVAQEREREAGGIVRDVTGLLWDAPVFDGEAYDAVYHALSRTQHEEFDHGRDDWRLIRAFLVKHQGQRVVPVWM